MRNTRYVSVAELEVKMIFRIYKQYPLKRIFDVFAEYVVYALLSYRHCDGTMMYDFPQAF
jgi:hypothetical protein